MDDRGSCEDNFQGPAPRDIRDLLAFKIARLAAMTDRHGQNWTQSRFGLRLSEWRVLGISMAMEPATFNEIARALQMDKGQLSRLIKSPRLQELLHTKPAKTDSRTIEIAVTAAGKRLHAAMFAYAQRRNDRMVAHLDDGETRELKRLISKMTRQIEAPHE